MNRENPITIVLADDHRIVRQGLRVLLDAEPGLSVIGEASDGSEVLDLVERLQPDVLVLDLMMPGIGGLEVARRLQRVAPRTRVVVLSMYSSEVYVVEALRCGVSAYVLKDTGTAELIRAIREAMAGRHYLSPPISDRAIEAYLDKERGQAADPYGTLTPREREVLHLTIEGLTSAQTAERLGISPRTAEVHRANILHKLGLRGQADLVRYAYRRGILSVMADEGAAPEAPEPPGAGPRREDEAEPPRE